MSREIKDEVTTSSPACTKPTVSGCASFNCQIEDMEGEKWEDVLGYDGIYLVSNMGRIKSYQREIDMGVKGVRIQPERIMKQQVSTSNFMNIKEVSKDFKVTFCVNNVKKTFQVAVLVGNAFVGRVKKNEVFSKINKKWFDIRSENLEIKSVSDCFKIAYEKGNNLRKKNHLITNHKNLFIYIRCNDGKRFTGTELCIEYKSQVRPNIKKAIKNDKISYGSKWHRVSI